MKLGIGKNRTCDYAQSHLPFCAIAYAFSINRTCDFFSVVPLIL